ncbi:MAG: heme exporter protein CcmB [Candidatus Oxydemutatoraceae bacterium WSBS_2016_MAG_OTU14]
MLRLIFIVIQRELRIVFFNKRSLLEPLVFFAIVALLFPLSLSSDVQKINEYGFSIVWITILLSSFLSLEKLFQQDYFNGTLEQLLISKDLTIIVFAKIIAHWLIHGVPLTIFAGLYAVLMFLPINILFVIIASLLMATFIVTMLGGISAALTVSLSKGSMLTGLLVIPFYLPVLIFGTQLSESALLGLPVSGYFAFLGAMLLVLIVLTPFFASLALKLLLD